MEINPMTKHHSEELYYLDDLEVGQEFITGTHAVDEEQIIAFAQQFDPQPFHIDAQQAKNTIFGSLVASGWHTASLTMRLMIKAFPFGNGTIGLGCEINWPNPLHPGDIIHVEGKIMDIKPSQSQKDRSIVIMHAQTKNQRNEVVQKLRANLLLFNRNSKPVF
jgi:acyl dehydratase